MTEKYKHQEQIGKKIGTTVQVHRHLENEFLKVAYQRVLVVELQRIPFEKEMQLTYRTRRNDFFTGEKMMLEIKSVIQLEDVHPIQTFIGLLVNYGGINRVMKPNEIVARQANSLNHCSYYNYEANVLPV